MDLYELLETTEDEIQNLIDNKEKYYISYAIRKKNGKKRYIDAPQGLLKAIQNRILYRILYKYRPHPIAHGFTTNRSPVSNAKEHIGSKTVITVDLLNFFNSIKYPLVKNMINYLFEKRRPYDVTVDDELNILTELVTYRAMIPQGAPTSPALSNLILLGMDKDLSQFAKNRHLKVTRYCDDITMSTKEKNAGSFYDNRRHITSIRSIVRKYGLLINNKKTRVRHYHKRQVVTGIVVNEKLNVPKLKWRNFRAKLHNILRDKTRLDEEELQKIRGYIEWINNLNSTRGQQFMEQYEKILKLQQTFSEPTISE
jgi:retron-type reverse transcriptase